MRDGREGSRTLVLQHPFLTSLDHVLLNESHSVLVCSVRLGDRPRMLCFLCPVPDIRAGLVDRCLIEGWWTEAQDGVEEQLCETHYLKTAQGCPLSLQAHYHHLQFIHMAPSTLFPLWAEPHLRATWIVFSTLKEEYWISQNI